MGLFLSLNFWRDLSLSANWGRDFVFREFACVGPPFPHWFLTSVGGSSWDVGAFSRYDTVALEHA